MKILKILITLILLTCSFCPTDAKNKPVAADKIEYMNLSWWKQFGDENLDNHLLFAYENNKDLKIATASTKQAQQVVKMAFADQLPQLSIDAHLGREFPSATTRFGHVIVPH